MRPHSGAAPHETQQQSDQCQSCPQGWCAQRATLQTSSRRGHPFAAPPTPLSQGCFCSLPFGGFCKIHKNKFVLFSGHNESLLRWQPAGDFCAFLWVKNVLLYLCCRASWKYVTAALRVQHALSLLLIMLSCVHEA